jgi:hypothetical protein
MQFYIDAATGNLPNFAWINPRSGINISLAQGSNDDHPDHDIALGEQVCSFFSRVAIILFCTI